MNVLTPTQYGVVKAVTAAGVLGAIALNTLPTATPGTALAMIAAGATAMTADAATSWFRHGRNTRFLGWMDGSGGLQGIGEAIGGPVGKFIGKSGLRALHIPIVGIGLGVTFGGLVDPLIEGVKHLVADKSFEPMLDLWARLFIGIEPQAVYTAVVAPKGKKLKVLVRETGINAASSAVGTVALPAWDGIVHAATNINPWTIATASLGKAVAILAHYCAGYLSVLGLRTYDDNPWSKSAQAEIAASREAEEAANLARLRAVPARV